MQNINIIDKQLELAVKSNYDHAFRDAESMEFRHGDYFKYKDFQVETEKDFYLLIINSLLSLLEPNILITRQGIYLHGDEVELVNPKCKFTKKDPYIINAKIIFENENWYFENIETEERIPFNNDFIFEI